MMTTQTDELTFTRAFNITRDRVWHAWTNPESLKDWWGPRGFTAQDFKVDLQEGGEYYLVLQSPEGKTYRNKGTYREIRHHKKLVMTNSFADENGNIVPASYYGMSQDFPRELLITMTLEGEGGKTRMTLHQGYSGMSGPDLEYMKKGWEQSLDKLADFLGESREE